MARLDDGLARAIRDAVQARREEAVSLLQQLVRTPSATGREGAVGEVVERASPSAVSTWTRGRRRPRRWNRTANTSGNRTPTTTVRTSPASGEGGEADALSCSTRIPTPWTRETLPRGGMTHSRAPWRAICSTAAVPAT